MRYTYTGGEFEGFYRAERKAKELGFAVASMQRDYPIAVATPDMEIYGKWTNLCKEELQSMSGVIVGDKRNSPVTLIVFDDADINTYGR